MTDVIAARVTQCVFDRRDFVENQFKRFGGCVVVGICFSLAHVCVGRGTCFCPQNLHIKPLALDRRSGWTEIFSASLSLFRVSR